MTMYCVGCVLVIEDSLLSGQQQFAMREAHQRSLHTLLPDLRADRCNVLESRSALTPISRIQERYVKVYRQPEIDVNPRPISPRVKRRRAAHVKRLNVVERARLGNTDTHGLLEMLAGYGRGAA